MSVFSLLIFALCAVVVGCVSFLFILKMCVPKRRPVIGFFHPYCDQRAGGEKVLWTLIHCLLLKDFNKTDFCIYTNSDTFDDKSGDAISAQILKRAEQTFNIPLSPFAKQITFVLLKGCHFVNHARYPYFTMLLQSLGSIIPAVEAILALNPAVMIDSSGYSFTYPVFKWLGGCRVACYKHYPTISEDMVRRVETRQTDFNQNAAITRSAWKSTLKLWYYRAFAKAYKFVGHYSELVMVNSHWTQLQLMNMWHMTSAQLHLVFPPCPVEHVSRLPMQPRFPLLISVSQFRPEKKHKLQIDAFHKAMQLYRTDWKNVKFHMIGTVRDADRPRIAELKQYIKTLGLEENISILENLTRQELTNQLGTALMGIHTMKDEHFGIGVVELLASGVITIAHRSGGPMLDIVQPCQGMNQVGFLADTVDEYAEAIVQILQLSEQEPKILQGIQTRAREKCLYSFSEQVFVDSVQASLVPFLKSVLK